jgi:AhpD family alkylhydroperoxidase
MSEQPRVALRKSDGDDALAALYTRIESATGGVPKLYQALANAPGLLEGWIDFAWRLRNDAESDRSLRELAILRVAQLSGSDYVWRSHWKLARRGGATEEQIAVLDSWATSDLFSDVERAVLQLTDELTSQVAVDDKTWVGFAEHVDDSQAVEIVLTISWYSCAARIAAGLGIPLEDSHASIPGLPR